MLAEAIKAVVDLGQKARQVEFHANEKLPNKVFIRSGDQLIEKDSPAPLRAHKLLGFDDLVAAVKDASIAPAPEVYVSGGRVCAFLDRAERRSMVAVELVESKRFQLVTKLQQPVAFEPREAIKMLRFDLHGGDVDGVIQSLRRVDFKRTSGGASSVEHGKESLGRSVEAVVQQADQIPDRFTLTVPIWSTPGFSRYSAKVEFGVYLDLDQQKVELRVLADEIDRVRNQFLAAAHGDLAEALPNVPIFLGTP
jgi:hypothetical protein